MARPRSELHQVVAGYYRGRGLFNAWDVHALLVRIEALEAVVEDREKKNIPLPEEIEPQP